MDFVILYGSTEGKQMIWYDRVRNNVSHDLTLIKLFYARFVRTGGFLIRYFNGHTK